MPFDLEHIKELRPANQFQYFDVVGSTMSIASQLITTGAPHGTVVIADEQTAGVGRFGRHWHSEPESGLYCSILLRLPVQPAILPIVTLALGLATSEAIQSATGLACDLRWPNDVLIHEYKVAGILAQLQDMVVIAGIGINVNQASLPSGLRTPATSLRMASGGRIFARERILVLLLESLDEFCATLVNEGPESILRAFAAASSYVWDRRVIFEDSQGGMRRGTTVGLDENGFLRVRDESGLTQIVYTGGIRPDLS